MSWHLSQLNQSQNLLPETSSAVDDGQRHISYVVRAGHYAP